MRNSVDSMDYGVIESETNKTSTSGCGSSILEMGALSQLTGDPIYELVALQALRKLWSMRSSLNQVGTTLDVTTGQWIGYSSGIGAGFTFSLGRRTFRACFNLLILLYRSILDMVHGTMKLI
ncbi:hypothetical protein Ddye_002392 [Dipteronia dyeriana]|uniref:Uncharacterized protein n=1 Tax=Dipteronia dyeriana TaxID=168575 RepID=A0AAD9XRN2_9ROSI|nr:hypothetical protein Ddye_002392 [Dipteronia dyeriana]